MVILYVVTFPYQTKEILNLSLNRYRDKLDSKPIENLCIILIGDKSISLKSISLQASRIAHVISFKHDLENY